ncbi:MAG: hypothetical protein K2Z81_16090, partial [Cyanobacteria bacterium]|nr:hypothetical protein [Cyanobacteriota bacterium]
VNRSIETIQDAASENRPHQVRETTEQLVRASSDVNNPPLAPHLVHALREEYQQWKPGTAQRQRADEMLLQVADNLLRDPNNLANPRVQAMLREVGPSAVPALQRVPEGGAERARRLIETILQDERNRRTQPSQ